MNGMRAKKDRIGAGARATSRRHRGSSVRRLGALLLLLSGLVVACGGTAEPTPEPIPDEAYTNLVSVTGEVLPAISVTVSAQAGGTAEEVLVGPGDAVAAGDLLVRLNAAEAELAVARAQVALDAAQARVTLLKARPRPEEVAVAQAQVEAAKPAVDQAVARLDQLKAGSLSAEIVAARAQVTLAEIDDLVAYEWHEDTMKCFNVNIPGQEKRQVCPLLGPQEEKARLRMEAAGEALDATEANLYALLNQRDDRIRVAETAVESAKEQQSAAEAQLAQAKVGASAEEIAGAEAAIEQAEVALEKAQVALQRTEVRAPLGGTVGMVELREQELVIPGQPLITLGDLETLRVETTDLDEIDVARVEVGQTVDVTFDALPNQVFTGQVKRISPMAESSGGGVNYTAIIELEELDEAVRWGMTAFVDIEVAG
ncbi:MAG: efflux RND transporter periplasmic adaptor subunit [Anaerolineae bacterium]